MKKIIDSLNIFVAVTIFAQTLIWSDIKKKEVWLIEVTVCFDTNAAQADMHGRGSDMLL